MFFTGNTIERQESINNRGVERGVEEREKKELGKRKLRMHVASKPQFQTRLPFFPSVSILYSVSVSTQQGGENEQDAC